MGIRHNCRAGVWTDDRNFFKYIRMMLPIAKQIKEAKNVYVKGMMKYKTHSQRMALLDGCKFQNAILAKHKII